MTFELNTRDSQYRKIALKTSYVNNLLAELDKQYEPIVYLVKLFAGLEQIYTNLAVDILNLIEKERRESQIQLTRDLARDVFMPAILRTVHVKLNEYGSSNRGYSAYELSGNIVSERLLSERFKYLNEYLSTRNVAVIHLVLAIYVASRLLTLEKQIKRNGYSLRQYLKHPEYIQKEIVRYLLLLAGRDRQTHVYELLRRALLDLSNENTEWIVNDELLDILFAEVDNQQARRHRNYFSAHLGLYEAPTGIGKSYAYLTNVIASAFLPYLINEINHSLVYLGLSEFTFIVPTIDEQFSVLLSTETLILQSQLEKDWKKIVETLLAKSDRVQGILDYYVSEYLFSVQSNYVFRSQVVKTILKSLEYSLSVLRGQQNYICLRKIYEEQLSLATDSQSRALVKQLIPKISQISSFNLKNAEQSYRNNADKLETFIRGIDRIATKEYQIENLNDIVDACKAYSSIPETSSEIEELHNEISNNLIWFTLFTKKAPEYFLSHRMHFNESVYKVLLNNLARKHLDWFNKLTVQELPLYEYSLSSETDCIGCNIQACPYRLSDNSASSYLIHKLLQDDFGIELRAKPIGLERFKHARGHVWFRLSSVFEDTLLYPVYLSIGKIASKLGLQLSDILGITKHIKRKHKNEKHSNLEPEDSIRSLLGNREKLVLRLSDIYEPLALLSSPIKVNIVNHSFERENFIRANVAIFDEAHELIKTDTSNRIVKGEHIDSVVSYARRLLGK